MAQRNTCRWIKELRQEGTEEAGRYVVLRYKKGGTEEVHRAFLVSARIGSAVARNKVKRRLGEIFRTKVRDILEPGFFLFIARRSIINAKFEQLENDMIKLILRNLDNRN